MKGEFHSSKMTGMPGCICILSLIGVHMSLAAVAPSSIFAQSERGASAAGADDDLPRTAPAGCEGCQGYLDLFWQLKDKADQLPDVPPYLLDELEIARQDGLHCLADCGPEPTPEPTEMPPCPELYKNSTIKVSIQPPECAAGCNVTMHADVFTEASDYKVTWPWGLEGDDVTFLVAGNGDKQVTAFLQVLCAGQWYGISSDSDSYTVHDPPYSISGPSYSGRDIEAEVHAELKCECVEGSPDKCPLTVVFDREECRTITFNCSIGGEIGIKAIAALKSEIGWSWGKNICTSTHAGTTVDVPCGWQYMVTATIYREKAGGEIKIYTCSGSAEESPYEAANYTIEVKGAWREL